MHVQQSGAFLGPGAAVALVAWRLTLLLLLHQPLSDLAFLAVKAGVALGNIIELLKGGSCDEAAAPQPLGPSERLFALQLVHDVWATRCLQPDTRELRAFMQQLQTMDQALRIMHKKQEEDKEEEERRVEQQQQPQCDEEQEAKWQQQGQQRRSHDQQHKYQLQRQQQQSYQDGDDDANRRGGHRHRSPDSASKYSPLRPRLGPKVPRLSPSCERSNEPADHQLTDPSLIRLWVGHSAPIPEWDDLVSGDDLASSFPSCTYTDTERCQVSEVALALCIVHAASSQGYPAAAKAAQYHASHPAWAEAGPAVAVDLRLLLNHLPTCMWRFLQQDSSRREHGFSNHGRHQDSARASGGTVAGGILAEFIAHRCNAVCLVRTARGDSPAAALAPGWRNMLLAHGVFALDIERLQRKLLQEANKKGMELVLRDEVERWGSRPLKLYLEVGGGAWLWPIGEV